VQAHGERVTTNFPTLKGLNLSQFFQPLIHFTYYDEIDGAQRINETTVVNRDKWHKLLRPNNG
jgi:hypothetical protein